MSFQKDTYIGKGIVEIKNRATGGVWRFLSNCESLSNSFTLDEKTVPDNTAAGGGEWDSLTRIKEVSADIVMFDWSAENLALVTNGSTSAATVTPITGEALTAGALGEEVSTASLIDTGVAPVVKDEAGTTTYDVGDDYTVSEYGITPAVGGTMVANAAFQVSYTPIAGDVIETLTTSPGEYTIRIKGLNEADSGKPVRVTMHRAKAAPTDKLDWIADDFGKLTVKFKLLSASEITAAGKSKYLKVEKVSALPTVTP